MTQRRPWYSACSSSLTNPLPDYFKYSQSHPLPHSPDYQYFTSFFRPDPLPSRFEGVPQCLEEAGSWTTSRGKRSCSSSSSSNCHLNSPSLFSLSLSFLCSLSQSCLLSFLISPSLSTIPSYAPINIMPHYPPPPPPPPYGTRWG